MSGLTYGIILASALAAAGLWLALLWADNAVDRDFGEAPDQH